MTFKEEMIAALSALSPDDFMEVVPNISRTDAQELYNKFMTGNAAEYAEALQTITQRK